MFSFLFDSFRGMFASPPPTPSPVAPPSPPPTCPPELAARVDRVVSRLVDLDRLYGLGHFNGRDHEGNWRHDLKVMAASSDLKQVQVELLDHQDNVAASIAIPFGAEADGHREFDDFVTPLIQRQEIRSARILVSYNSHDGRAAYRRFLRLEWNPAEARRPPTGGSFSAGASVPGRITLRAQDRHALTIQNSFWDRGYGYAFTAELPGASVFVHAAYCPDGFRPEPGGRLTAHLVQTDRGLQARDVRPA